MIVTVVGWEKYNGRRNHLQNAQWFKFWHSAFDSVSMFDLTPSERWIFLCCLGAASMQRASNGSFECTIPWFAHKFRVETEAVGMAFEKMKKNGMINYDATLVQHQCDTSVTADKIRLDKIRKELKGHPSGMTQSQVGSFEAIWEKYPNRVKKKAALRSFTASVKTPEDLDRINAALHNYLQSETFKKGFVQNGSTWFANWEDWVDKKPTKPYDIAEMLERKGYK